MFQVFDMFETVLCFLLYFNCFILKKWPEKFSDTWQIEIVSVAGGWWEWNWFMELFSGENICKLARWWLQISNLEIFKRFKYLETVNVYEWNIFFPFRKSFRLKMQKNTRFITYVETEFSFRLLQFWII